MNARPGPSEKKKIPLVCGIADGETRTRTGDTTIFSRYVLAAERRGIPGNEGFWRVGPAPLIFAICAGFHAFQGMAGLPSPYWPPAVCSGGEPEVGALVRRPGSARSERRCQFGRGARSSSTASVVGISAEAPAFMGYAALWWAASTASPGSSVDASKEQRGSLAPAFVESWNTRRSPTPRWPDHAQRDSVRTAPTPTLGVVPEEVVHPGLLGG